MEVAVDEFLSLLGDVARDTLESVTGVPSQDHVIG
jgi:hypothetical protein